MEIRRKLVIPLIAIGAFLIGFEVSGQLQFADSLDNKCGRVLHAIQVDRVIACMENQDKQLGDRVDATNDVFFKEIQRLDTKIENGTRATPPK